MSPILQLIFQVDNIQLAGYTNQEAVEILKSTGKVVKLSIVRYLRGLKFEELQEGITQANVATPTSPYPQTPATPGSTEENVLNDEGLSNFIVPVSKHKMAIASRFKFPVCKVRFWNY